MRKTYAEPTQFCVEITQSHYNVFNTYFKLFLYYIQTKGEPDQEGDFVMGLFGNSNSEDKTEKLMAKYGLESISPKYADKVKDIASELSAMEIMETGMKLSLAKS